jgi:O-antigen ligase
MISMIFGLASLFRFLQIYRGEESTRKPGPLIAQGTVIAMAFYLLWEANSATAFACFFLAGGPMVLTYLFRSARKPAFMNIMVLTLLAVPVSALFLNVGTSLVENLGRNSTLTGRTFIWRAAFSLVQNPLFGTGFESFWLGPRYVRMGELIGIPGINEAHNGYIEVFLNLGWVGIALLTLLLVTAYRRIATAVRWRAPAASLRLAYFMVAVAYNFSEAAFKMMSPVWITFLLAAMVVSETPLTGDSPSLVNHGDDLAEGKPEVARAKLQFKPGRPVAQRVHREVLQRTRKL